jgi:predicted nucleotidyltransferase
MKFTDEQLNSFIVLYEQEFGERLDRAEALRQAIALVSLVKLTYKPMSRKDWKKYTKHLEKDFDCDII